MAARDWLTSSPAGGARRADERIPSQAVPELDLGHLVVGCTREGSATGAVARRLSDGVSLKGRDAMVPARHFLCMSLRQPLDSCVTKGEAMDLVLKLGC